MELLVIIVIVTLVVFLWNRNPNSGLSSKESNTYPRNELSTNESASDITYNHQKKKAEEINSRTLSTSQFLNSPRQVVNIGFELSLHLLDKSWQPQSGEKVSLWSKPNSESVLLYANDRFDYREAVAITKSRLISTQYPSTQFTVKGWVKSKTKDRVTLQSQLDIHDKNLSKKQVNDKFFSKLSIPTKKNLKTTVVFCVKHGVPWNSKVYLSLNNLEAAITKARNKQNWELINEGICLNDQFGEKISLETKMSKKDISNLVRNYRSGFILHCKYNKDRKCGCSEEFGTSMAWDTYIVGEK